jgi:hypothetical protein
MVDKWPPMPADFVLLRAVRRIWIACLVHPALSQCAHILFHDTHTGLRNVPAHILRYPRASSGGGVYDSSTKRLIAPSPTRPTLHPSIQTEQFDGYFAGPSPQIQSLNSKEAILQQVIAAWSAIEGWACPKSVETRELRGRPPRALRAPS